MTIRKATLEDIPYIAALLASNQDTILQRSNEEIEKYINYFYLKITDHKIVGCCCLEVYSPKIAEVRSVAVADDYRMHGYGTELVQAAIDDANKLNIREIMVVTSNPKFFEKMNFNICLNEKYALFWNNPKLKKS